MREIRTSGSEGGETGKPVFLNPYRVADLVPKHSEMLRRTAGANMHCHTSRPRHLLLQPQHSPRSQNSAHLRTLPLEWQTLAQIGFSTYGIHNKITSPPSTTAVRTCPKPAKEPPFSDPQEQVVRSRCSFNPAPNPVAHRHGHSGTQTPSL